MASTLHIENSSTEQTTHLESLPVNLSFQNLTFTVQTRDGGTFEIPRSLTGYCHSGRLQALMGASGAGKTTLLDLLAGNLYGGKVDGQIYINGVEVSIKALTQTSCYVMQHPILLSSATVRECLMTSALLRLSKSISRPEKERLVLEILSELGLEDCADVLVGSEKDDIKGISGGQMRRLAIGVELVTRPKVIVLDEPTSGLDSEIALTVMNSLKILAQNGRTVTCSIHQPNSDIVETFDDFHLLAHGKTVFLGPWDEAVPFFQKTGFPCPMYKNPTDFFMFVLKDKDTAVLLIEQFKAEQTPDNMENSLSENAFNEVMMLTKTQVSDVEWWFQTYILWIRFLKTWIRNPILFWSEFVQYIFTAVFTGLMYFDLGNSLDFSTHDRYASQFFILASLMFTPAFSAVTLWDAERKLLKVETNRKSYSIFSYYLAKTATTWPMELFMSLSFTCVVYYMIGYQSCVAKFFNFFLVLYLFQLISETLGLLAAVSTTKSHYATIILSLLLLVLVSFTGFIVRDIPIYFEWIKDIAYVNYATAALVKSELVGVTFIYPDQNKTQIPGSLLFNSQPFTNDLLLESNRQELAVLSNDLSVMENILVLVGMLFGLRIICFIMLLISSKYRFL